MTKAKSIVLQVRGEGNKHLMSTVFEYKTEGDLMLALQFTLPQLCIKGFMTVENNELEGFSLSGVKIQTNANYERQKHYEKTGN
jgi:hypothetical protein